MSDYSYRPRKRFGQNFLHDPDVIQRIIELIHPNADECLVEIGSGQAALTRPLLKHVAKLDVIEIDRDLAAWLKKEFEDDNNRLNIHNTDVLAFDFSILQSDNLRIIGNLPYNISTPILFHLLNFSSLIKDMLFMLQKELVDRICASPCNHQYGRLSVMLQYHCQVESLMIVKSGAFKPAPKVDSAIVRLTPRQPEQAAMNINRFSRLVKDAFSQRRKTIRNALRHYFTPADFEQMQITARKRPQEFAIADYVMMSNYLQSPGK